MPAKACPKPDPQVDGQYARASARLKKQATRWAASRPPPAPAAPALSAAEKAKRLGDLGAAPYLYGATAAVLGEAMDIETWALVLGDFLAQLGVAETAGPVARLLGEQLLLAHHAVGRLHVRAGTRASAVETTAYHAAIGRLMGECRRTALALQALAGSARRTAAAPRTRTRPPSGVRPARRAGKNRRTKVASSNRIRGRIRGKHPVG
jgi:hypothetical protein